MTTASRRWAMSICAAAYRWSDNIQFYAAMDNLGDVAPPVIPTTGGGSAPNSGVYDVLGRTVRFGVRFND